MRLEEMRLKCPVYADEYWYSQGPASSSSEISRRSLDAGFQGRRCVDLTNRFRLDSDLMPLRWSEELFQVALAHAEQMAGGRTTFSHDGFADRCSRVNTPKAGMGENLAYNKGVWDSCKCAVDSWISSEGHRKNLVGNWTHCGVASAQGR